MADDLRDLIGDGFASPLGDVIAAVGRGVAEAQAALDRASLDATLAMYETDGDAGTQLLREIGYRPTFYVLPETSCEVQVSMRVGGSGSADGSAGSRTYVTPLDAGFANRFSYAASAAAKLTFKVVPVPAPAALDDSRPAPQLLGMAGADAAQRLASLGLAVAFVNVDGTAIADADAATAKVTAQQPAALGLVPLGEAVRVTVG